MTTTEHGFGMLDMLLALAGIMLLAYVGLKFQSQNPASMKDKLKSYGVALPPGTNPQNASQLGEAMGKQMTQPIDTSTSQMKCAIDGSESCKQ